MAYDKSGRPAEAVRVFEGIHHENPGDRNAAILLAGARFHLGVTDFSAGDYPAALREFRSAESEAAGIPHFHSYLGLSLLFTGDAGQAAEQFAAELAVDSADYPANFYLAQILASRGDFTRAKPLVKQALVARPESAEARKLFEDVAAARFDRTPPPGPGPAAGQPAPALDIGGMHLPLPVAGRPSVLVFGSYTCPNFRSAAPALNELARKYSKQVSFLLVYIREAHAADQWQSTRNEAAGVALEPTTTMTQRHEYAAMCVRKLHVAFPSVVDPLSGPAEKAFAAWPSRVYVIGLDGRVKYAGGLNELEFDRSAVEASIREVMARPGKIN